MYLVISNHCQKHSSLSSEWSICFKALWAKRFCSAPNEISRREELGYNEHGTTSRLPFPSLERKKESCGTTWVRNNCGIDFKHNYCLDSKSFFRGCLLSYSTVTAQLRVRLLRHDRTMARLLKMVMLWEFHEVLEVILVLSQQTHSVQPWNALIFIIVLFLVSSNVSWD